jgi:hypothetical protein
VGSGRSEGRARVRPGRRRNRRRRARARSEGRARRLHRLEGRRPRHRAGLRHDAARAAVGEEGHLRNGRQERGDRRRVGRPRRDRARRAPQCVRLLRAEVLGMQPRDRRRQRLRDVPRADRRRDEGARRRRSDAARHRHRPRHRRGGGTEDLRVRRDRREGRETRGAARGPERPRAEGRQAVRRPRDHQRHPPRASPRQRGDLRPGPRRDEGEGLRRGVSHRERDRLQAHRRRLQPQALEPGKARRDFRVGNLYLNRGITGALVGRQPFGGFGMSGVGSKAGGRDYLLQFVEPRAVTENTMRRGFAPNME